MKYESRSASERGDLEIDRVEKRPNTRGMNGRRGETSNVYATCFGTGPSSEVIAYTSIMPVARKKIRKFPTNICSTRLRAHGVLRRNVRLDWIVG